jgi:hypothetical protein
MAQNELNLYKSNRGEESQLVDWTKAAGSLTSGIATAAGMRELRRAENEQFKKSAEEVVGKEVDLSNQSMDKLLMNASFSGRDKIVQLNNDMRNGRISRAQYKAAMADISTNWKNTADYISNIDKRYSEALERQETDKASEIEIGIIEYFGQLNDIGNKAITFDDNGSISLSILDDKGKPTGAYQNINSLNNLMNSRFDKVDLVGMVTAGTEKFPDWKNRTVTDIRMSPTFTQNKNKLVNTILADPRSTASILVDYGNFGYYFVDKDGNNKQKALEKLQQNNPSATEADLILMEQNEDGRMNAKLTPEQLKAAQKLVDAEIEQRFRREVDFAPGYGSGGSSGLSASQQLGVQQQEERDTSLWRTTYDAFNAPNLDRDLAANNLTAASGGTIIFSKNPKGNGYIAMKANGEEIFTEANPMKHPKQAWTMIGQETEGGKTTKTDVNWEQRHNRFKNVNSKTPKAKQGAKPKIPY